VTSDLWDKLDSCTQGNRSIDDYVYELEELHMMIGISDKQQRVLNLWKGLNQDIRQALWWEKLNHKVLPWKMVVEAAERFEVSKQEGTSKKGWSGGDNSHSQRFSSENGRHHQNRARNFKCERRRFNNGNSYENSLPRQGSSRPNNWRALTSQDN
jgi:hypothetical protein